MGKLGIRLFFLSFLLILDPVQLDNVKECVVDTASSIRKRAILGGKPANEGQFPYVVSINVWEEFLVTFNQCSGSLITTQSVLTAAHCTFRRKDRLTVSPAEVEGYAGTIFNREFGYFVRFSDIKINSGYHYHPTKGHSNDIAVLVAVKPVRLGRYIQTVPLAIQTSPMESRVGTVMGWGCTSYKSEMSSFLNYVGVSISNTEECEPQQFPGIGINGFCFGSITRGAFIGDSGGPFIVKKNRRDIQLGVISTISKRGPSLAMNVTSYSLWINFTAVGRPEFIVF